MQPTTWTLRRPYRLSKIRSAVVERFVRKQALKSGVGPLVRILLVEDDACVAEGLLRLLRRESHVVDLADSLQMAKSAIDSEPDGVVLLDRLLPDGDGTQLIFHARQHDVQTRFLILSARREVDQRVEGLDLGADDYMVKPFEPDELCARIRALGRRLLPDSPRRTTLGQLCMDRSTGEILTYEGGRNGSPVALPRRELTLLRKLMERCGRVVTREALETAVYGYKSDQIQSNALESHVSRLRKRLAKDGAGVSIHTVWGIGYMLKEER